MHKKGVNLAIFCYTWHMELTSPTVIKELLAKYQALPNKLMGQNFLIDAHALSKVVDVDTPKDVKVAEQFLRKHARKSARNLS